jgi:flagellar biosynthesis protein
MEKAEDKKALAIKREEDGALKVIAYGQGRDAEAIIEKARENDIEVVRDPEEVVRILEHEKEKAVPEKIYQLIGEIVTFVTELNEEWFKKDFGEESKATAEVIEECAG